jgi:hypothetical protein
MAAPGDARKSRTHNEPLPAQNAGGGYKTDANGFVKANPSPAFRDGMGVFRAADRHGGAAQISP